MRKILVIGLILLVLLGACEGDDETPQPVPLPATTAIWQERTSIRFAIYDWEMAAYEHLIAAFEEENPGLRVQAVSIDQTLGLGPDGHGWPRDAERRLLASADVANLAFSRETVAQGLVRDLTPLIEADTTFRPEDYYPGTLQSYQWDGGTWALPTAVSVQVIFYDKDAFDRAGLAYPWAGWNWDGFLAASRALTVRDGEQVTRWGFVQASPVHLPFVAGRAGPLVDQGTDPPTPRLDQLEVIEAVRWYADLYLKEKVMPYFAPAEKTGVARAETLIDKGQAAMWADVAETWAWRKEGANLGVAPYPVDEPASHTTPAWTRGLCLSAGSRQPEAAWRWLSFLSRQPLHGLGPMLPSLPPRRSVAQASGFWDGLDEELDAALRFAIDHAHIQPVQTAGLTPGYQALERAMDDILQGKKTVEAALAEAQALAQLEIQRAVARRSIGIPTPDFTISAGDEPAASGQTAITFVPTLGSPDLAIYRALAERFHKAHPDIVVEVRLADLRNDLRGPSRLAQVADCFQWIPSLQDPQSRAAILSLEPFLEADPSFDADDFYPHLLAQFTRQGQLWGLPGAVALYVVEYNRDLFEAAGLEYPALDWTWDDFVARAVALAAGEGANRQYGFVAEAYELNDLLLITESLGARLLDLSVDPPAFSFDDPSTVEAVRRYASLTTEYGVKPVLAVDLAAAMNSIAPHQEREALIAGGQAAMWTTSALAMPSSDERSRLDVGVAPLPAGPHGTRGGGLTGGYFVSAQAEDPWACWHWITFLTGEPAAAQGLPARRSVAKSDEYQRQVGAERAAVYQASVDAVERPSTFQHFFHEEWLRGGIYWFAQAYSRVLVGEASIEEALAAAQALADAYRGCVLAGDRQARGTWQACARQADPALPEFLIGGEGD